MAMFTESFPPNC